MAQEPGGLKNNDDLQEKTIGHGVDREIFDASGGDESLLEGTAAETADEGTDEEDDSTGQIRAEIDETRSEMSETIDAIQDRLSLANLQEQVTEQVTNVIETAKDNLYQATLGKAVIFMKQAGNQLQRSQIGRTVVDNPLPFVLIGAGAAMLAYNSWSGAGRRSRAYSSSYGRNRAMLSEGSTGQVQGEGAMSSVTGTISSAADRASHAASEALNTVSSTANSALNSVSTAASSTYQGAADLAKRGYEKAGELGSSATETYHHYVEEKPLAVAAAAAAVGAAIGLALPSTRYESNLMGETRENLLHKVEESATHLVDRAKQAATEAGRTVKEELGATDGPSQPAI